MPEWGGDAEAFVDGLLRWLAEAGKTRYDAEVSQLEHALQTAARAVEDGADDEAIASALLHDVGHLVIGEHRGHADFLRRDEGHEAAGARWLARALPPSVTRPVELHVSAKQISAPSSPRTGMACRVRRRRAWNSKAARWARTRSGPSPPSPAPRRRPACAAGTTVPRLRARQSLGWRPIATAS